MSQGHLTDLGSRGVAAVSDKLAAAINGSSRAATRLLSAAVRSVRGSTKGGGRSVSAPRAGGDSRVRRRASALAWVRECVRGLASLLAGWPEIDPVARGLFEDLAAEHGVPEVAAFVIPARMRGEPRALLALYSRELRLVPAPGSAPSRDVSAGGRRVGRAPPIPARRASARRRACRKMTCDGTPSAQAQRSAQNRSSRRSRWRS